MDYKRDISGLDVLDLVAFANSESGVTILNGNEPAGIAGFFIVDKG
ncbi:MAG: hypothetical protein KGZ63_08400 [Clostridiales bacterium]|nr:hypothetical protein [Clostridiales bacterium]